MVTLFIRDGKISDEEIPALSERARIDLEELGPTFIKAGQMMSVRPDVLPQSTLDELTKLQDSVVPFDTTVAVEQIERELGGPLGQFFTSISEEPVAAASLAQVYLATLNDGNDTRVAVKVQRPDVLGTVSKDLYVLRRAAEVFQGLVERFAPQQKTNYVDLLNGKFVHLGCVDPSSVICLPSAYYYILTFIHQNGALVSILSWISIMKLRIKSD